MPKQVGSLYRNLVKPDTFLGKYMAHMEEVETATAYDFWCGLWLLSVAMGRNVYVDRPRAKVHVNLYAILVADSGITRKSSAISAASSLASRLDVELISSKATAESLEQRLDYLSRAKGETHAAIAVSELATFLGRSSSAVAVPALLTDLYDCPESRKSSGTVGSGPLEIKSAYISFLAASTPAWLLQSVNPNVVEGGFTSRCLFIFAKSRKKKIAWPSGEKATDDHLLTQLQELRAESIKIGGKIALTKAAIASFTFWYNRRPTFADPFRESFQSREDAHVLRFAAFLCINDRRWVIDKTDIHRACKIVAHIREQAAALFELGGEQSEIVIAADKIRATLLAHGSAGIPMATLTNRMSHKVPAGTVRHLISLMHDLQLVHLQEITKRAPGGRKARTQVVYATQAMKHQRALDEVLKALKGQ